MRKTVALHIPNALKKYTKETFFLYLIFLFLQSKDRVNCVYMLIDFNSDIKDIYKNAFFVVCAPFGLLLLKQDMTRNLLGCRFEMAAR